jgi:hypothetical protein
MTYYSNVSGNTEFLYEIYYGVWIVNNENGNYFIN